MCTLKFPWCPFALDNLTFTGSHLCYRLNGTTRNSNGSNLVPNLENSGLQKVLQIDWQYGATCIIFAPLVTPQKKHVWPKMNVEVCFSRQLNEHRVFLNDQHHVLGGHSNLRGLCKDMCCWYFAVRHWCEVFSERVGHQWHCPLQSKNLSQCTLVETGGFEVGVLAVSVSLLVSKRLRGSILRLEVVLASHWPDHVALQLLHFGWPFSLEWWFYERTFERYGRL